MDIFNLAKILESVRAALPDNIPLSWNTSFNLHRNISLDAASLIAIADLKPIAKRTAITGSSSILDVFVLAPGLHTQQSASELNNGEYPATGAMTSGYVFRVENQATVRFLQSVGKTGHLTTVRVGPKQSRTFFEPGMAASSLVYLCCPIFTTTAVVLVLLIQDWWALAAIMALMTARLLNVFIVKTRSKEGWKGAAEDGNGDLMILLSQDRWVRMQGAINDLKAVTSGEWLRPTNGVEDCGTAVATLLVFGVAGLAGNASNTGSLTILLLLLVSVAFVGWSNGLTRCYTMYGRVLEKVGQPKQYKRRLDMALELIEESGRDDWAVGLGMIAGGGGKAATM